MYILLPCFISLRPVAINAQVGNGLQPGKSTVDLNKKDVSGKVNRLIISYAVQSNFNICANTLSRMVPKPIYLHPIIYFEKRAQCSTALRAVSLNA
jgi:hypothetical protein